MNDIIVRQFGVTDYARTFSEMRRTVDTRDAINADEMWVLQHFPVFTQGQGGRAEHLHDLHGIPLVQSDRGGQVTYHGPGQVIVYLMIDLRRQGIGPRELVRRLESGVIAMLAEFDVDAERRRGAPGVYVAERKIAALGLRIRRGISYHGLSLNVDVDLAPFSYIDPCGYAGLGVTSLAELGVECDYHTAAKRLVPHLLDALYEDDYKRRDGAPFLLGGDTPPTRDLLSAI